MKDIVSLLWTFLGVILILYLAFICSKYIGRGSMKLNGSKYMKIVDRIILGQDRSIIIVQVGERYLLISNAAGNMQILKELTKDDMVDMNEGLADNPQLNLNFKDILNKFKSQMKNK